MNKKLLLVAGLMNIGACAVAMASSPQAGPPAPIHPSSEQATRPAVGQTALQEAKARSRAADEFNKIVCKNLVITGSRMPRKLCHTHGEWMAMEAGSDQFMEDLQAGMRPLNAAGSAAISPQGDSVFSNPGGAKAGATPPGH